MEDLLIYLAKSAGLLLVFYGFYLFILRKDTSFARNRKFLLGGLVTSAILPAVYFTKTVIIEAQPMQFTLPDGNFTVSEMLIQEPTLSLTEIIFGLYLAGIVVMTGRIVFQLISLYKVIRSGKKERVNGYIFVKVSGKTAPFSFMNYIVFNPGLHTESELQHILKHEKTHVSHWHTMDVLLANLNLVYQWFNPIAWGYTKSIQQNLEFIADSEAVKDVPCKKEYQKALVKISVNNFNLALTSSFYQSFIKKRIVMLNKNTSSVNNDWKIGFVFPFLVAFIFLFNVRTEAQVKEPATETETGSERENENEISIQNEISFEINRYTTRETLEEKVALLKEKKVDIKFDDLEYNEAGVLTNISASFIDKNNNSTGSFIQRNKDGIPSFTFIYNPGEGSRFTTSTAQQTSASANTAKISKTEILSDIKTEGKNPVYVLDGEKIDKAKATSLNPSEIQNITVLKGANATSVYGKSAKDGAVVITTQPGNNIFIRSLQTNPSAKREMKILYDQITSGKQKPLIVIDGEIQPKEFDLKTLDQRKIESMNLISGDGLKKEYGRRAKEGLLVITTNKATKTVSPSKIYTVVSSSGGSFTSNKPTYRIQSGSAGGRSYQMGSDSITYVTSQGGAKTYYPLKIDSVKYFSGNSPIYIVDGKEMPKDFDNSSLNSEQISSMMVLKDKASVKKYGKKGENGVIEITMKKGNSYENLQPTFAVIKAGTTDEDLKIIKEQLKERANMDVNFTDVKRNSEGLITSIRILGKTKSQEINGTFNETGEIPDIYIGVRGKTIYMSSTPPNQ